MQKMSGPGLLGNVIFSDVAEGAVLCPLVPLETWTRPTGTVIPYKLRVLMVCPVIAGRSVLCAGW